MQIFEKDLGDAQQWASPSAVVMLSSQHQVSHRMASPAAVIRIAEADRSVEGFTIRDRVRQPASRRPCLVASRISIICISFFCRDLINFSKCGHKISEIPSIMRNFVPNINDAICLKQGPVSGTARQCLRCGKRSARTRGRSIPEERSRSQAISDGTARRRYRAPRGQHCRGQ